MNGHDLSYESSLNRSVLTKLHDDGWFITFGLMALVLISGVFGLYRVQQQQEMIRQTREELAKIDEMLQERTSRFRVIEQNQQLIMDALKIQRNSSQPVSR